MKIAINLATRPYIELQSLFLRLRLLMGGLAVAGLLLALAAHWQQSRLNRQQADMDALRRQTVAAQKEKRNDEARMLQPANAQVLDRARFLNALFLRKSFSWTGVMMDLEHVLPSGVQVTAIEPQTTADGDVNIRLRVSGQRDRAVLLVRNLEHSARFLHPRLTAETAQNKQVANGSAASNVAVGGNDVEFDILAGYNPLPAPEGTYNESTAVADTATPDDATPVTHHARRAARPGPADGVVLAPYRSAGGAR